MGKRRAGAVAQQSLQSGPVLCRDAHPGIQREAAVVPSEHPAHIVWLDQLPAGKLAQHAHPLGNGGKIFGNQLSGGLKAQRP